MTPEQLIDIGKQLEKQSLEEAEKAAKALAAQMKANIAGGIVESRVQMT